MGAPRSATATCRHCSEKIFYRFQELDDEQKKENQEREYQVHYKGTTKQWFHSERAWEVDLYCPSTYKEIINTNWAGKEYKSHTGPKGAPKEFCHEQLKDKWEECNKPVVPDSGEHRMCGIHWGMMRREMEERERREQEAEIRAWAAEARRKKEEEERQEREKKEAEERAVLEKKLEVLRESGLEFEVAEPPRRRSWEPIPNPPPPTKVTVPLDALVAILDKER